jgi:uncharacterized protein
MDPGLLRDVLVVLTGTATGVLSGLVGVGGAVISTPAIRLLGVSASLAVATTLPSIIPGAASGTLRYSREHMIDASTIAWTAPLGVVAVIVGSLSSRHVPGNGHVLMLVTAALLGWSALRMGRSGGSGAADADAAAETDEFLADDRRETGPAAEDAPSGEHPARDAGAVAVTAPPHLPLRLVLVGIVAGLMSGLLGVGGGVVMVPGFTQFGRLPIKRAIATSLACVALFAIPGTITHGLQGEIDWPVALLLCVGVIPGARLGATIAVHANEVKLRRVVAVFLGFSALLYAAGELAALMG